MAEAVQGKKLVYLYRVHSQQNTTTGTVIAFTTENSRSISKDADVTATKDGSIRTPAAAEIEVTATSILKKGDTFIDTLEDAMKSGSLMDIWEANLERPGTATNTFKGIYFQGYITSMEFSSNAEDFVEISLTFGINGIGARGDVTVTQSQQDTASYVFADTTIRPNDEAKITAYKFVVSGTDYNGIIDSDLHTVTVNLPSGTSKNALVATFTLSSGASAKIGSTAQVSGTTSNNFTSPQTYVVTAEDTTTTQNWVVTANVAS